ncbi:MAG: condensation domain-containing protein, partial [Acidobacteriota bacterium]
METVLSHHPRVATAAVLLREDQPGQRRLVAYLECRGEAPDTDELRRFLQAKLPEYMLPAAFVILSELPLNRNRKLDRQALPAPEELSDSSGPEHEGPRDPIEAMIYEIWREVLGHASIGIHDNFFELGGHSLIATQVTTRLSQRLGSALSLRSLFEAPTVAELAARVRADRRETAPAPAIRPRSSEGAAELSFAQERLWFLDRLDPNSAVYTVPIRLMIRGDLRVEALRSSLESIVARHEPLRTTFRDTTSRGADQPVQVIAAPGRLDLPQVDLSGLPEAGRDRAMRQLSRESARRPFDLEHGPLLRFLLLRLASDSHSLVLVFHHIVFDGWSLDVLLSELRSLYSAPHAGLPELPIQYADFAVWQREWLRGETLEAELAFWRRHLADTALALELPTDRPYGAVQTFRGDAQEFQLGRTPLRSFAEREGVSEFMVLLAVWSSFLARWSGQRDFLLGSPVANRNHREIEGLIGLFANTLVLRCRPEPGMSFREHLRRVRDTALDAYAHQDLPFEKLVEALQPPRDLARSPLVQVKLALHQEARLSASGREELELFATGETNGTTKFELTLDLRAIADRDELGGAVRYNSDLFDASTACRIGAAFRQLLASALSDPASELHALPLSSRGQRHQMLAEWSDTALASGASVVDRFVTDRFVTDRFAHWVAQTPEAPAVRFEGEQLSYRELDQRSRHLAQRLRRHGVGPEVRVGLAVDRSLDMVVALLAVLEAGGAYVPLDLTSPTARLRQTLEDCDARILLVQEPIAALSDQIEQVVVSDGATDLPAFAEPPRSPLSESLAYVIYTSGSTRADRHRQRPPHLPGALRR